jgi:hypothetical protein
VSREQPETATATATAATDTTATDTAAFYAELTTRNAGVIDKATQDLLGRAKVLIAGCGSIGGAAVEPLARLGVRDFVLADPGDYELNNLNRQNATFDDLGRNKAEVAAERIRAISPQATVSVLSDGVNEDVVVDATSACDLVVDGVDVTTKSGLRAKYLLHQHAQRRRLPLFTGWDMAGAQYVRVYDYRTLNKVFDGQISGADVETLSMWQLLQRLVPARYVPIEMIEIARDNLANPDFSFPQLVYAADLFGALAARIVVQLLTGAPVREHIYVDLHQAVRPLGGRVAAQARRPVEAIGLLARLRLGASR